MTTFDFDQVWESVKAFTPNQRRRLRKLIDALRFKKQPLTPEDELSLRLLRDGVIEHIPHPLTEADIKAFEEYQPVPIEGKPLSETVIEERR